jgi:hypothetical protein
VNSIESSKKPSQNSISLQSNQARIISSIAQGVSDVIGEFFIKKSLKFDLVICGQTTPHIEDLTDEVLSKVNEKTSTKIHFILNYHDCFNRKIKQSTVFFVKFFNAVQDYNEQKRLRFLSTLRFSTDSKILFYVQPSDAIFNFQVSKLKNLEMNLMPIDAYELLLVHEKDELKLKTISYFTEGKCEEPIVVELNSMSKTTGKWNKQLENVEPLMNLYGCLITFINDFGPSFYANELKPLFKTVSDPEDNIARITQLVDQGNLVYRGFFHDFTQVIAKKANFTANHQIQMPGTREFQFIPQNNKVVNTFLTMDCFTLNKMIFSNDGKTQGIHITTPFMSIGFYYLITPNEFYTNYEKLFFAFETYAWISFGLTFGFTLGAILVVNRVQRRIQNVIFGVGIRNPTYNAISIFFGISQAELPRENFARVLLAMFLFLCLIFRTCYQSRMFEFMTSDMRKPLPETIEDIISMEYTVVILREEKISNDSYSEHHAAILNGRPRLVISFILKAQFIKDNFTFSTLMMFHRETDFYNLYYRALIGNVSKLAFMISEFDHQQLNSTFMDSLVVMKSESINKMITLSVGLRIPFSKHLDRVMDQLISSGIAQHMWDSGYWGYFDRFDVDIPESLRVLALSDLEFGFVIWLATFPIPIIAFICELYSLKAKIIVRKLAGLYEFLRLLRARMSVYHDLGVTS